MLPTPLNWLQRPSMPHSWQIVGKFSAFLQDFTDLVNNSQRTTAVGGRDLEDEYFEQFQNDMLSWATPLFWSAETEDSDWRAFSYFQTAVYSEMEQWFKTNQTSLRVRYLDLSDQAKKDAVDMAEQFYDWINNMGLKNEQPHITFDGFASGILMNKFSQAILCFISIGGELFGFSNPESITVAHNFKDGIYEPKKEDIFGSEWQSFCSEMIESFIEFTEGNIGFEGLGSLFG